MFVVFATWEIKGRHIGLPLQRPIYMGDRRFGQMFLAALSSGTVVALLQLLKSYIEWTPKIKITIEYPDGRKMSIEGEDLKAGQLEQTTEAMKQLCEQTSDKGNG